MSFCDFCPMCMESQSTFVWNKILERTVDLFQNILISCRTVS